MKKILVIGGNGSGKTTFSKKLGENLDIPVIHLDKIARTDNWQRVNEDVINRILRDEIKKDKWIIDGNDTHTLSDRLKHCDTVFYFDFSTFACLRGVIKRTIENYGKHRDDVGGENNIEKFDAAKIAFFKAVIGFNRKNRKRYYDMLSSAPNINVVVFKNRKQADNYLARTHCDK
ncbi:MAG: topology modulation protein [Eubacterium sp.]